MSAATDPVVRWTAGGIVLAVVCAALAVCVHGYWLDAHYQIPTVIDNVLVGAVAGALPLLGVHVGGTGVSTGVTQGQAGVKEVLQVAQATNGHTENDGGTK